MTISKQELEIFSRHLILKEFNDEAFSILREKQITIIGLGGIGCPAAEYLIATGLKKIKLIDFDKIQATNLNRQLLYSIKDIGKFKSKIAKKKLIGINPKCKIEDKVEHINSKNIDKHLKNSSLVIDTTDNWKTMLLVNKYCVSMSIPLISSSVIGFESQTILFNNEINKHLCLQCIFTNKNEPALSRCDTVGVLGTAAGMAGLVVAQKTINYFLKQNLGNFITMVNIKSLKIENIKINKNINCEYLKNNLTLKN